MVRKVKVATMALGAVFAFSALGAATASAEWLVGGTVLTGSAAVSPHILVHITSTFLVPALGVSLVCGGSTLDAVNALIIAPDRGFASSLSFLGCNVTVPATGCALEEKGETISTTAVLGRAFLGPGEEDRVLFSPETKGVFTNISFSEKNTCAFNGLEPVKGSFISALPTGRLNLTTQSLVDLGSVENNSLEVGGQKAFMHGGKVLASLTIGSAWSFM
jgi:hypothetical protein